MPMSQNLKPKSYLSEIAASDNRYNLSKGRLTFKNQTDITIKDAKQHSKTPEQGLCAHVSSDPSELQNLTALQKIGIDNQLNQPNFDAVKQNQMLKVQFAGSEHDSDDCFIKSTGSITDDVIEEILIYDPCEDECHDG